MVNKLNTILLKSAAKYAANTAVEDLMGNCITYDELDIKATHIKDFLIKYSVTSGTRIGIVSSKHIEYIAFIFGIMRCGAAYVPIDVNSPIDRNISVFDDCSLKAVFIEKDHALNYIANFKKNVFYDLINFNEAFSFIVFKNNTLLHKQDLAYILYTSGSTGVPKGVMHTHQSALAFVNWSIKTFKPEPNDRFSSHAPFHFDLSVFDVFVPLSIGATLVIFDEKTAANPLLLASTLSLKKINYLYATPTTLTYLYNFGKMNKYNYSFLKYVLFAGEAFPIKDLIDIKSFFLGAKFYNLYGPTETNVCTYFKIPEKISNKQLNSFPIGKPCSFAKVKINHKNNKQGELLVSGKSVMSGYWNDTKKTKLSFQKDNFGNIWYKTGDIVELNAKGHYVYLSRKDRMIKRRGYRIELGEIETVLSKYKSVLLIAVLASSKKNETNHNVTAHLVLKNKSSVSELELYQYCQKNLPAYMIPDQFVFHKTLPLTSTHKIDYKTLSSLYD